MNDLVKSAARAFEILEVFANARKRMNATEVGQQLGYPKSSMNVLLKSLTSQGYLSFSSRDMTYFPTLRVTQLGDWVPAALFGSDALLNTLETLRDRTHETITLTMAAGFQMHALRVLLGKHPIALQMAEGFVFPMFNTGIGAAYLSTRTDEEVLALAAKARAARPAGEVPDNADILTVVAQARKDGYAAAYDRVIPDTGAIAAPLISEDLGETLVIAVAGLGHRIKKHEPQIVRELKRWTKDVEANASAAAARSSAA